MKLVLKGLGALLGLVLVGAVGFFLWARSATAEKLARTIDVHAVDFPIPYPLTEAELAALRKERTPQVAPAEALTAGRGDADAGTPEAAPADPLAGLDLVALAKERALARGKHLVEARYACAECHGKNFGGGVMVDDPAMGSILGPNITAGKGGKTANYTAADWDRIVRHGVKSDGHPSLMPSQDFRSMSDQELSDIITFVRAQPVVDNSVPPVSLGPVGTILVATGKLPLSADLISEHRAEHAAVPPEAVPTAEFGKHLASICTGCHRANLAGGPIMAGPPDWPAARNLTPHAQGLAGWTYAQFVTAMREGTRPDGSKIRPPMTLIAPYARSMSDVELQALWAYLSALPAAATGT